MSKPAVRARRDLKVAQKLMGEETESEFGRGFLQNIFYFHEHFAQRDDTHRIAIAQAYALDTLSAEEAVAQSPGVETSIKFHGKKAVNALISSFMNGASDHLYDLIIPNDLAEDLKETVQELKDTALEMGHGKGLMDRDFCTFELFEKISAMSLEIMRDLDFHVFGIICEEGNYR